MLFLSQMFLPLVKWSNADLISKWNLLFSWFYVWVTHLAAWQSLSCCLVCVFPVALVSLKSWRLWSWKTLRRWRLKSREEAAADRAAASIGVTDRCVSPPNSSHPLQRFPSKMIIIWLTAGFSRSIVFKIHLSSPSPSFIRSPPLHPLPLCSGLYFDCMSEVSSVCYINL